MFMCPAQQELEAQVGHPKKGKVLLQQGEAALGAVLRTVEAEPQEAVHVVITPHARLDLNAAH